MSSENPYLDQNYIDALNKEFGSDKAYQRLILGEWDPPNKADGRFFGGRAFGHTQRFIDAIPTPLTERHTILCPSSERAAWVADRIGDQRADCVVWFGELDNEGNHFEDIYGAPPPKTWAIILEPLKSVEVR